MIWDARSNRKKPELYKIRSEMEARIALLRTTRSYVNDIIMMKTLLIQVYGINLNTISSYPT